MLFKIIFRISQVLIVGSFVLFSVYSHALDIYENGILSIPKVVVDGNVYSNVKITVKEILSINRI